MNPTARVSLLGYEGEDSAGNDRNQGGPWMDVLVAQGTTHTNTTTQTALNGANWTFQPGELRSGSVIEFDVVVKVLDQNGTDTLLLKVYCGGTALTTSICTPSAGAHAVADNDYWRARGTIVVRDADDSGTYVAVVECYDEPVQTGSATQPVFEEHITVTGSVNFEAPVYLQVGATYSAAHADNQCAVVHALLKVT